MKRFEAVRLMDRTEKSVVLVPMVGRDSVEVRLNGKLVKTSGSCLRVAEATETWSSETRHAVEVRKVAVAIASVRVQRKV